MLARWVRGFRDLHWQHWLMVGLAIIVLTSTLTNYILLKQQGDIRQLQAESKIRGQAVLKGNETNNKILKAVLDATSPEAGKARDARLANAIQQLKCDQQWFIEKSVRVEHPDVMVMSAFCRQFYLTNPPPE